MAGTAPKRGGDGDRGGPLDAQQPVRARRLEFHPHARIVLLACLLFVVALGIGRVLWPAGHFSSARPASFARLDGSWPRSPWLNTRPEVKYVGDAACARCHADIAKTFGRHPMGRSLAPIASAPAVGSARPTGTTTFGVAPSVFTIERRGGREIHREAFLDGSKVLAQVEGEVAYAVGSGAQYLVPGRARGPTVRVAHHMVHPEAEMGPIAGLRENQRAF